MPAASAMRLIPLILKSMWRKPRDPFGKIDDTAHPLPEQSATQVGDSCSKPQCRHTSARRFLSIVEIARMVSGEKSFDKIRIDSRLRADHVQQSSDLASRGRPDGSCDGVLVLKGLK